MTLKFILIFYSFLVCQNCEPARNTVLLAPVEWIGNVHHTQRKKLNVEPRPKQMTFKSEEQLRIIVWDRDNNASRNMIYKALCMLRKVRINPDFNKKAYVLRQQQQRRRRNMSRSSLV